MAKFKRVPADVRIEELSPLNISCTSTKCQDELHCFKTTNNSLKKFGQSGVCKECGANLIEWRRLHQNDIKDVEFTVKSLQNELIRHVYWHTKIDDEAIDRAKQLNRVDQRNRVLKVLKSKIKKSGNPWDGRQTPLVGKEIIFYAQHATATCCRTCLAYWHNIDKEHDLDEDEMEYCADLIMFYIESKINNDQIP